MSRELKHIDASQIPDLLAVAEEVRRSRQARLIQRAGQDLAILTPVTTPTGRPKGRQTSTADPLWNIAGLAKSKGPTDVSSNKHRYLAQAYRHS